MNIERRRAEEADIPFLLALRLTTMDAALRQAGRTLSEAEHLQRVRHAFEHAEILLQHGAPIGLLKLRRDAEAWEVLQLQVLPAVQGQGVGRRVLDELIEQAETAGAALTLSVLKGNPAKRLYERLGFVVEGETGDEYRMRHRT